MKDTKNFIYIEGARENNLQNINVTIPKNKFVVVTGISGSGKTSLAFDTVYQEGQRRYMESLSSYARQFLGSFEKPDVDVIEGLSPAISISQRTTSHNPRSTVGTVTEIYDYLRLFFARIGTPYDPITNEPLVKQTIEQMVEILLAYPEDTKLAIMAPVVTREKGTHDKLIQKLLEEGLTRFQIDGENYLSDELPTLQKTKNHDIAVVIDRLLVHHKNRNRLFEALEFSTKRSKGMAWVVINDQETRRFSENYQAQDPNFFIPELEPRLFSFNTPIGACAECNGLGVKMEITETLVLNENLSINEGAILPYQNASEENITLQDLEQLGHIYGYSMDTPFKDLTPRQRQIILYGTTEPVSYSIHSSGGHDYKRSSFEGIIVNLNRRYLETSSAWIRDWLEQYMSKKVCPHCQGKRLNEAALCVKVHGHDISQICDLSVIDALHFFQSVPLTNVEKQISELILKEIISRLEFLSDVGLNYLTLSRSAVTLSGGEAQRIRLATQIGSKLTGVIYILDEPSIGLHQKDNQRLINTLKKMRDLGNTIIVVEHDLETMEECDHLIDIGPFAGHLGGKLMASASPQEVCLVEESITGQYLSGRRQIPVPAQRRLPQGQITLTKVTANNLKGFDVAFPLGVITVVTGVSGSGKSTLVNETLYKGLLQVVKKSTEPAGAMESLKIQGKELKNIIEISQAPIGRTPRSNPATYTRLFDDIRDLFAQMRVSRERGYVKARFSFNVKGGRCESCNGDGVKKISMHFLPDVYVKCEDCGGKRYNKETLDVLFNGYNIAQVLEMTVDEALELFVNFPKPYQKLRLMQLCGLGYLHLGQSSLTLSGGEAQRIKLASELYNKPDGQSLYILDEPTTGLHSFDVEKLLVVLHQIADSGATVVIIEHNLDVIKNADYIIDLGPEGGLGGGQLLCCGTPEEVSQVQNSYTGQYLKQELERSALRQKNKEQAK